MKNVKTQSNFRASRKNTFLTAKTKNEKRKTKNEKRKTKNEKPRE
jgi:hypothetical protein